MSVQVGDNVGGRYRLTRKLGSGGMGTVFEAEDVTLGRSVAVKVLKPEVTAAPGSRARFEREARVASQLDHPGAVQVHEFGEADGTLFLVMQILTGTVLRDALNQEGRPAPIRSFRLVRQIAATLEYAHGKGVVHRDVKPENILINRFGDEAEQAVLVDFGIAFLLGSERDGRLTKDGAITGTPDYCAPEQVRGREIGPPADVYALGCVLMELLTGHAPFEGEPNEIMARHMFVDAPALSDWCPDVAWPRELETLVGQMLSKEPRLRITTGEVIEALGTVHDDWDRRFGARRLSEPRRERMVPSGVDSPVSSRATLRPGKSAVPTGGRPTAGKQVYAPGADATIREALSIAEVPTTDDPAQASLILAIDANADTIDELVGIGPPVIATARTSDHDALLRLLRLGVYDVITVDADGELRASTIAARMRRALGEA